MYYTDNQGNRVPISEADQRWLNDSWFHTQQLKLPTNAPRASLTYRVSTEGQVDHDDIPLQKIECRKFAQNHGWRVVEFDCASLPRKRAILSQLLDSVEVGRGYKIIIHMNVNYEQFLHPDTQEEFCTADICAGG